MFSLDVKIQEEDKILLFLSSLPMSYKHFLTMLMYGKNTSKIDKVTTTLLSSEIMKTNSEESREERCIRFKSKKGEIQGERIRRSGSSKFIGKRKVVTCYYCEKEGHFKRDCPR